MKRFTKPFSYFLVLLFLLIARAAEASHLKGGDTYIICAGNGQYELVFACYYACEPTSIAYDTVASDFSWSVTSSCGTVPATISAVSATPPRDVPFYCPGVLTQCDYYDPNNPNGPYAGAPANAPVGTLVIAYTSAPFSIPPGCTVAATMYFSARNAAISNLLNASGYGINIVATITTPLNGGCVSDPEYAQYPVNVFCNGQNANFSQGAIDLNGDSLTYTLVNPEDVGGAAIPFVTGCDSTNPLGVGTGAGFASSFTFDTTNGNINFTPTATGDYVLTVRVNAYSNGALVGSTMRDIQFTVVACNYTDNAPTITSKFTQADVIGGTVIDSNHIGVCPGEQVTINLMAADQDPFQYIIDSTNVQQALPGSSVTVTHSGTALDTSVLHITWTPQNADSGYHYFLVTVRDTFCPTPGRNTYAFEVSVLNGVYAGPNLVYCNGGSPVTIYAGGSDHYVWTDSATGGPPVGVLSYGPDSSYIVVAPGTNQGVPIGSSVGYVVTGDLLGSCKNKDTVSVKDAQPFTLLATAQDTSICKFTSTILTATPTPASVGPFTYSWTVDTSVVSPSSATTATVSLLNNTKFYVVATSAGGCAISDSVSVNIVGAAPRITILPSTNDVCPGDTIALNSAVYAENIVPCGLTDSLFTNNTIVPAYLNNDTNSTTAPIGFFGTEVYCSPFMGSYNSYMAQYLFTQADLNAAGLSSGTITDFAFFVKTLNSSVGYDTFSVSMGCTGLTSLTGFVGGLQVVIPPQYGANAIFPNQGWTPLPFTNYFNWDGASNIIIQICYTINPNTTSLDDYVSYSTAGYNCTVVAGDDFGENIDGCSLGAGADLYTIVNTRPNILFHISEPNVLTYHWTPASILCDTCPATSVVVEHDTTYTLTVSDGTCTNDNTVQLLLNPAIVLTATPDTTLCGGNDTVRLNVTSAAGAPTQCVQTYTVAALPYSPISGSAITIPPSAYVDDIGVSGDTDDGTAGPFSIGFNFPFYCETFSQFYVNSNGWITFEYPYPATTQVQEYTAQTLPPAAADLNPQKTIELAKDNYWLDDGQGDGGGNVGYFVTGTAPNRTLVIQFNNMLDEPFGLFTTTGEMHLHEGNGVIDILIQSEDLQFTDHTTGIKDSTGLGLAAPGRNNAAYTISTPEAWRFTPQLGAGAQIVSTIWSPNLYLSNDTIIDPLAYPPNVPQTYYVTSSVIINPLSTPSTCVVTDSVTIKFGHTASSAVAAVPPLICPGDTTQITVSSPDSITSYSWRPSAGLSNTTISDPKASVSDTTTYYVTIINSQGCVATDTVRINSAPVPTVALPASYTVCDCYPDSVVRATVTGGTPAYTYIWSNTGTDSTTIDTSLNATSYTVTVSDANHCTAVSNTQVITMNCPKVYITISPLSDTIFLHDTATLTALTVSGSGFAYLWSSDSAGVLSPALDSTHVIGAAAGADTVHLLVTDQSSGCTYATDTVVHVIEFGGFVMGTAFTPNGDQYNQYFYPSFNGPNSAAHVTAFRIYDRWGQLVYNNPNAPGWDGSFAGTAQPSGAYVYFVTVETPDPTNAARTVQKSAEGNFMLFR